jgi:hypothetical protein
LRGGKTIGIAMRKVSPDGRTLTITDEGVNRKGETFSQVLVFDRKGGRLPAAADGHGYCCRACTTARISIASAPTR